jgi:hypothetical protein
MIKEKFSISNSRLSVVSITATPGNDQASVKIPINDIKKMMRYQVLSICDATTKYPITASSATLQEVNLAGRSIKDITAIYALVKEPTKSGDVQHTAEEVKAIMSMVYSLPDYALGVKEQLLRDTKDTALINCFYDGYGDKNTMRNEILSRLNDQNYSVGTVKFTAQTKTYSPGKRYSIYRLIHDLVDDNAKILLSADLVGKYSRITASKKIVPGDTTYLSDDWCHVTGYTGNKHRANLSLQYQGKVQIDVPANQVGVVPGPRELKCIRTVTLIKDGRPHIDKLGVIVSEKLARRLRGTGCVEDANLIYKGGLLLNLTKLPVISKAEIKKVASWYLAELEVKKYVADLAIDYIGIQRGVVPMPGSTPAAKDPKDAFLNSLGIYGDTYVPNREKPTKEGRQYSTREVHSSISGVENDPLKQWKFISDYVRGTQYQPRVKSKVVMDHIIKHINPKNLRLDDLEKEWTVKQKKIANELRDRKFQLIMSKTMDFNDARGKDAMSLVKSVQLFDDPTKNVTVSWKIKTKNIKI